MKSVDFDTLPQLSQGDALEILKTPLDQLKLSSDYYKAVYHLSKYPSFETERALLDLLKIQSLEQSVLIAKRKAIEVLGKMRSSKAIPYIGENLNSDDPYIVENSALALAEIGCNELKIHKLIGDLLDKTRLSKRVLIQCLGRMHASSQLQKISQILNQKDIEPGIKGASIAAISNITNNIINIDILARFLDLPNQNDRICAVEDIIDAKAYSLIPLVLKTPISPFFRIRAIVSLAKNKYKTYLKISILDQLDSIVVDDPENIRLIETSHQKNNSVCLISDLFNTDFNKAYLALLKLKKNSSQVSFDNLEKYWDKFKKDYGALYFLVILFRYLNISCIKDKIKILEMIKYCLDNSWPDYMKFKPQAIFSSSFFDIDFFLENIENWLDFKKTKYWFSRYSSLVAIERLILNNEMSANKIKFLRQIEERNEFVKLKLDYIILKYL